MHVAVDVGGTFTDVVIWSDGDLRIAKAHTTPGRLSDGVVSAISKLTPDLRAADYVMHGTTIVINALLQRRGAKTALVTTRGFRDVLEIARGTRYEPYDFLFERESPLVRRRLRFEVNERMAADGRPLEAPTAENLREIAVSIERAGVESVAVCLLNAYANGEHERLVGDALRQSLRGVHVTLSHELVQEWREYERTSTTVMNAYVMPLLEKYIGGLGRTLEEMGSQGRLLMMHSSGGSMAPSSAAAMPLALVESGPASGMVGAAHLTRLKGIPKAVAFDMGGTTAKACLILDHSLKTVRPYYIGRSGGESYMASLFPVLDVVEMGAGGGSLARVSAGLGLQVGPESAGADPGPVAYCRGGEHPTVTDADLVLGRLSPSAFLGGELQLDLEASRRALTEKVAEPLGIGLTEAAAGIATIVDNHMALAVRQVSIQRGEDPQSLTLIAFGGAGPGHAVAIAKQLGIPRVIVPPAPENFSAFGMLLSDVRRRVAQTVVSQLRESDPGELVRILARLESRAKKLIDVEAPAALTTEFEKAAELRYKGQERILEVGVTEEMLKAGVVSGLAAAFEAAHRKAYGYAVDNEPIQLVTLSVTGSARLNAPSIEQLASARSVLAVASPTGQESERLVFYGELGAFVPTAVVDRLALTCKQRSGPLLIQEYGATTLVPPGTHAWLDEHNNIVLEVNVA